MTKPEFYYHEFEDYLFMAIQISRQLRYDNCVDSDDILRQLNLAKSTVESFLTRINLYEIKELEPNGDGVAHRSHEGIDKIG